MTVPCVCLVVLDGWGLAPDGPGNAISLAETPVFDGIWEEHPHTTLTACGESVGLPPGQMGNSEVGHLNLGAGAIVPQDLARIDKAAEDGTLGENQVLRDALKDAERVHLIGLVSDGGVHASDRHLKALIELAGEWDVPDVVVHAFTDGRDTSPKGGAKFLAEVEGWGGARVGSVIGRYFAMDRDERWDRTQKAYDLLVHGKAEHHADTAEQAAKDAYERDETDEFIDATTVGEEALHPPRRRRARLQLPPRPHAPDHARAGRGGLRRDRPRRRAGDRALRDAGPVRRGLGLPGRVPARAAGRDDRGRDRRPRPAPAARRGDREVPARDVLLQRRRGARARGGDVQARPLPARRADLRPQARDERLRGDRRVRRALQGRRARVRDHQLRQRRHGRPHRRDRGGGQGRRGGRRVPRPRAGDRPRRRRRVHRHRRPRQRRRDARGGRLARHRPLAQPGAVRGHRRRATRSTGRASSPTSRRPRWSCSGSSSRRR